MERDPRARLEELNAYVRRRFADFLGFVADPDSSSLKSCECTLDLVDFHSICLGVNSEEDQFRCLANIAIYRIGKVRGLGNVLKEKTHAHD